MRTGTDGGVGVKPGDRYAVPLCAACHAKQHRIGELTFWSALRIDPVNVALRLWTVSADLKAGERTVFRARQQIDLARGRASAPELARRERGSFDERLELGPGDLPMDAAAKAAIR